MNILNFIPLSLWSLGFLLIAVWETHLMMIDGRGKRSKDDIKGVIQFYFLGIGFFTMLGIILSL